MSDMLFSGEALPFGGLSNETELGASVPEGFDYGNPWTDFAERVFFSGADTTSWSFQDEDPELRHSKLTKFKALIASFELDHEDKMSVGGWMLSTILTEVPEFVPPQDSSTQTN